MTTRAPIPNGEKAPPAPQQLRIMRGALVRLRNRMEYRGHPHWWARDERTGDEGLYPESRVRRWPLAKSDD